MQARAEEFLHLLNQLDEHLKHRAKRHEGRGFMMRAEIASRQDPVLQRYMNELREFSELRNAIVHYREYPTEIIAEPTENALERLRRIVEHIIDPPKVIPTFAGTVKCWQTEDQLLDALHFMDRQGHSQLPVYNAGEMALLSSDGIARWLAACASEMVGLAGKTVGDVLPYEKQHSFVLVSEKATVEQARQAFHKALERGQRLRAVLVTSNGQPAAKLLGIITAANLLESDLR
jgi:predicted transcriptional regulator